MSLRPPGSASRRNLAGVLVLAFLIATIALDHRVIGRDQYDDSYITYRYAANLAQGNGLVFNSYERTNSASSFLYTVVLAAAYASGFRDLELFGSLFGLAMGCLLVVATFRMTCRLTERPALALVFTFPLCIAGSIGGWAVSGMETIFFAALVATFLDVYLFAKAPPAAAFALLGLVVLCRTEGIILLALVAVREVAATVAGRSRPGWLLWFGTLAVAPLIALAVFNRSYYGAVLPHSLYLKQISHYYSPGLGVQASALARFHLGYYLGFLVLAGAAIQTVVRSIKAPPPDLPPPLPFLTAYCLVSIASFLLGPFSDSQRYTVHLLPVLAVLALAGWLTISRRVLAPAARPVATIAVALILVVGAARDGLDTAEQLRNGASQQAVRKEIGLWLAQHTQPGERIASADLGEIAYYALAHDFVDVFGLTSAGFAELSQRQPDRLAALFASRRPAYFADTAHRSAIAGADGSSSAFLTSSELILADPSTAFRNVPSSSRGSAPMPYARRPVLSLRGGGRDFAIVAIDWSGAPDMPALIDR